MRLPHYQQVMVLDTSVVSKTEKVYPDSGFSQFFIVSQKCILLVRDFAWHSNYAPAQPEKIQSQALYVLFRFVLCWHCFP